MARKQIHYGPFSRIGDRYGRFFDPDHFMGRDSTADTWIAPSNTSKKDNDYNIEVALPGFQKEEVSISVVGDVLEVSAQKKGTDVEEKEYLLREILSEPSGRKFTLPKTVDRDRISASFEDGILKIKLKNGKEGNGSKRVKIQ